MAITVEPTTADVAARPEPAKASQPSPLNPDKLRISLSSELKPLPTRAEDMVWGKSVTDHMLVIEHDPVNGWKEPEIRPYGPLSLDPSSSCFHYCPCVFEGMKAYLGPDGEPRLFRPELNLARLLRSAKRATLPEFDPDALLTLLKRLIAVEARWIPGKPCFSLYIRPTIIGTRPSIGVAPTDDYGMIYIILNPSAPFFLPGVGKPLSFLAVEDRVRAWPGGTGAYKMGGNYAPAFESQKEANARGYDQNLWLIGENRQICEAGLMNFMVVRKREDGDVDLMTPELDGTILPGVTRQSILELADAHTQGRTTLPGLDPTLKIHTHECLITMPEVRQWNAEGSLLEVLACGTASIVVPLARIGFEGEDVVFKKYEDGYGPVGKALWQRLVDIQEGRFEWEGWSVPC